MEIHVSKIDAAKRQLETAINLLFRGGDPVSIHTLTGAAFQILDDIASEQGIEGIHRELMSRIKDENKKEVRIRLNAAKNFFKHANKDPGGIIEFNPNSTTFYIWDACRMYSLLTKETVSIFKVYDFWFWLKNPECIILDQMQKAQFDKAAQLFGLSADSPIKFIELIPLMDNILYAQSQNERKENDSAEV